VEQRGRSVPIRTDTTEKVNKKGDYSLTNFDLEKMMKGVKEFRGVFMRDTLPLHINKHEATIVNLDSDKNDGTHWTMLYNRPIDTKNVYYFDSYGAPPPNEVEKYLRTSGKKIQYNSSQLQNILSTMCGYFCCYMGKELSKGKSFYDVLYEMSQIDPSKNDLIMKQYFKL